MTSARSYTAENIRKTVFSKNTAVMSVNMKYPKFSPVSKSPKELAFTEKINRFYSASADKYLKYLGTKYASKAARIYRKNGNVRSSFLMNCTVPYSDGRFVSVFADITHFDGTKKETVRFSQLWDADKSAILPAQKVFVCSGKQKKYVTEIILKIAGNNMKNGSFSYYSGYRSIICRKFSFSDFYFVPNGAAFFYNGGVLSEACEPCVFVVPFEKIDGLLKIIPSRQE